MSTTLFKRLMPAVLAAGMFTSTIQAAPVAAKHTFSIGDEAFLLDGKPFVIRTGEMHFARVPKEYWRHRLQLLKAMGMNAVCAYLFWNYHEWEPGTYNWEGQADAAEFCRIAQEEGLWVVLRPGPYVCAEWDGGGLPWWLLKNDKIQLRTRDADFMKAATSWYQEVGRVLGPLQITKGGPILMAQVENEYGSYGKDAEYIGDLKKTLTTAGFDIPFFACNPAGDLRNGARADLFNVVNFGRDPEGAFKKLREIQPKGPLMCGEYYPGWFDTWGSPHHKGETDRYIKELESMLKAKASFSLYMAHGGTTPGMWPGTDRPFKPDTNSYDYDAPISEAGWTGDKFNRTRELMGRYLGEGEKLPEPPAPLPVTSLPEITFTQTAPVFDNLPEAIADCDVKPMENYDQGHGSILYRTELPAGPAITLKAGQVHDFAWVFIDGKKVGFMDRRTRSYSVKLPAREKAGRLDILVEAMGHVNFGKEVHDRKGLQDGVMLAEANGNTMPLPGSWKVFPLRQDDKQLASLKWKQGPEEGPSFWKATFPVAKPADTFLDLSTWGKGVIWVNGHCLSRFWNIGPTQTAFLPGAWLKKEGNEIVILDLLGPSKPVISGLEKPILDQLRPELDFANQATAYGKLALDGVTPVHSGSFAPGGDAQQVKLAAPATGRQFCIESENAHDGKQFAAIAELDLLDPAGNSVSHQTWTIAYADSEEKKAEDGSATNAIDGQSANFWHTQWKDSQPSQPHRLVIDLGASATIGGFRYTPRQGSGNEGGRIKDYRIYVGDALVK
ncbi:beta-galactosidase [Luteolibacter ambystomatis]|uniref:Beta-galactosidase n=1 Tax=Luteolibacter ambystomatis TaxID=2824561 RepID=A0A975PF08_9BACT|nr:beta-galactosidase [Luteolibacter ambystomatis]QUE51758.1 beta-galactosidase [Luteolibacter ambystomatis]